MEVGHEFVDFKAFKAAMADWSITGAHKFPFRYQNSGKARSIVVCARSGCFFQVYAAIDKDRDIVEVITVNPNRICVGAVTQPLVQRTRKPCYSATTGSLRSESLRL